MEFLKAHVDYIILGILGLMSLIMLWKVVERYIFFARMDVRDYPNIHELNIALERNMTPIYTIGSNAPYVGLFRLCARHPRRHTLHHVLQHALAQSRYPPGKMAVLPSWEYTMKKFDQINVIPFIDIMLVLLAIVLMTATFISPREK